MCKCQFLCECARECDDFCERVGEGACEWVCVGV